jgi:hypothetical protein
LLRKLLPIHQLRQLPHNPVFRLVTHGRSGWVARAAFLAILAVEVGWLVWMGTRILMSGGQESWMEYLFVCIGYHALLGSLLLIAAMWAYNRPFTHAQKEDLWLTSMKPNDTVLAAMAPTCIGATLVILGVPVLLVSILLAFRLDEFLGWLSKLLTGGFFSGPDAASLINILGGWLEVIFVIVLFVVYLVIFLALWRVLMEGLIRTGTVRIVLAVRGLFIALVSGAIALQVHSYTLAFLDTAGMVGLTELLLPLSTIMLGLAMLFSSVIGAKACLGQFPGRRWFAGVVTSIEDEHDWLAGEESFLAMKNNRAWHRFRFPLGRKQLAFLPSAVCSGFVGAIVGSLLLFNVEMRSLVLNNSPRYDDELYFIPALILSSLLGGLLALRRGTFVSWRRHFLIEPGRIAASVRTTALVFGWVFVGSGLDRWSDILGFLIWMAVSFLPMWMLHCVLLCLWRLLGLRRLTTMIMLLAVFAMVLVFWYPHMVWSRSLAVLVMMPMAAAALFWLNGGSYWLIQKLFDQQREDMAAGPADQSPPVPEQALELSPTDHS